jgi:L-alanine-DL-glutamate epimerase-like enolase superfamily enzyme
MDANLRRIKAARAALDANAPPGEEAKFPLMIDCYMSLNVPYAVELAQRIEREA